MHTSKKIASIVLTLALVLTAFLTFQVSAQVTAFSTATGTDYTPPRIEGDRVGGGHFSWGNNNNNTHGFAGGEFRSTGTMSGGGAYHGQAGGLTFSVAGTTPSQLQSVSVNGHVIHHSHYVVNSGSTVITLRPEYLNTLQRGRHTIMATFTGTVASMSFDVTDTAPRPLSTHNPNTGA